MTQAVAAPTDVTLGLTPVAGRIGAEVRGIRLSGQLDDATVAAIEAALIQHKVLFFRDQQQLTDAEQEAFGSRLGEPVAHPTVPAVEGTRYLLELNSERGGRANVWHTDVTFVEDYPKYSVLRSLVAPVAGGDTLWANTAAAYAELPLELQELANHLRAVHSNEFDYATPKPDVDPALLETYRKIFTSTIYETEHPVVRVHPVSGERSLLLGNFVKRIQGLNASDSQHLFQLFQSHVTRPENIARWRWRAGDVAIWDNRSTQHYAVNDYGNQRRVARRITIAGDIPVGTDGRCSKSLR